MLNYHWPFTCSHYIFHMNHQKNVGKKKEGGGHQIKENVVVKIGGLKRREVVERRWGGGWEVISSFWFVPATGACL